MSNFQSPVLLFAGQLLQHPEQQIRVGCLNALDEFFLQNRQNEQCTALRWI